MREVLSIALLVQGIGGLVNRLTTSASPGWWLQLHALPPALQIPASVAMITLGGALMLRVISNEKREGRQGRATARRNGAGRRG